MIGTMLLLQGKWKKPGVYNVEEFNPDPFMEALNKWGLPWIEDHNPVPIFVFPIVRGPKQAGSGRTAFKNCNGIICFPSYFKT